MKLARTFIFGLAAMHYSNGAVAADWIALGSASSVDQYFYDRSKLTIKDDEITYWKKVVFKAPQMINGKEVTSGLLRERINCNDHTAQLISYLYYAPNGETVEYIAKDDSEAAPIIPDTVGDAFEQKLCPMVWRKQEEARIKAEQKAAEAELAASKQPAPLPTPPAATTPPGATAAGAAAPTPAPPTAAVPAPAVQSPPPPAAAPASPPAPAGAPTPAPAAPGVPPAPAGTDRSAAPGRPLLPMPQIIEQLY